MIDGLRDEGASLDALVENGYTIDEIGRAGYSITETWNFFTDGFTHFDAPAAGFTLRPLVDEKLIVAEQTAVYFGFSRSEAKEAGLKWLFGGKTFRENVACGIVLTAQEALNAKFDDLRVLKECGLVEGLRAGGISAAALVEAGFDANDCKRAGYGTRDAWQAHTEHGAKPLDAAVAGFSLGELQELGLVNNEVEARAAGFAEGEVSALFTTPQPAATAADAEWSCPICTYPNDAGKMTCDICDGPRPSEWQCAVCFYMNDPLALRKCELCDTARPP